MQTRAASLRTRNRRISKCHGIVVCSWLIPYAVGVNSLASAKISDSFNVA